MLRPEGGTSKEADRQKLHGQTGRNTYGWDETRMKQAILVRGCQRVIVRSNAFGMSSMASSLPTRPAYAPFLMTCTNWER